MPPERVVFRRWTMASGYRLCLPPRGSRGVSGPGSLDASAREPDRCGSAKWELDFGKSEAILPADRAEPLPAGPEDEREVTSLALLGDGELVDLDVRVYSRHTQGP